MGVDVDQSGTVNGDGEREREDREGSVATGMMSQRLSNTGGIQSLSSPWGTPSRPYF
jgi:hypothetical protein